MAWAAQPPRWNGLLELAAGWPVLAVQHPGSDDAAVRACWKVVKPCLAGNLAGSLAGFAGGSGAVSDGRLGLGPMAARRLCCWAIPLGPGQLALGRSGGGAWLPSVAAKPAADSCARQLFLLQCQLTELSLPRWSLRLAWMPLWCSIALAAALG